MLNFPGVSNFAFYPICSLYVQTEHKLAQGSGEIKPCFSVMVFHFLCCLKVYLVHCDFEVMPTK